MAFIERFFAAHSADPNIRYKNAQTVLHRTTLHSSDARLLKVLLEEGINVNAKDIMGDTALLTLCKHKSSDPSTNKLAFLDTLLTNSDLDVSSNSEKVGFLGSDVRWIQTGHFKVLKPVNSVKAEA